MEEGVLPLNNHVIVEMLYNSEGITTKGGIIIGFNKDVVYAEGEDSHAADLQEVCGRVWKAPDKLYFSPGKQGTMEWDTDMEIKEGDMVWFGLIEAHNAMELHCEGRVFKILPYSDLYVAKRGNEVICLNGYVLMQTVNKMRISDLDHISEKQIDKTKGVIRYVGKANRRYISKNFADHKDIREGDIVLLDPRARPFLLERKPYLAQFDGDNLYLVIQRRRIAMVLNR